MSLSERPSPYVFLSVDVSPLCLCVSSLSVCLSSSLSVCLFLPMSACLSVRGSPCFFFCLYVSSSLSVCLFSDRLTLFMGEMGSICHFPRALSTRIWGRCSQVLVFTSIWGQTRRGATMTRFVLSFPASGYHGTAKYCKTKENTQNDKSTLFYPPTCIALSSQTLKKAGSSVSGVRPRQVRACCSLCGPVLAATLRPRSLIVCGLA